MNILIVDDIEVNLYMLNTLLTGHGHKVFDAVNGVDALNILNEEEIDLIISDILMPVMDGFSLCIEVKKHPEHKLIPFIFYTATYTGHKDEEFALKLGADKFIVKPCDPEIIIEAINIITKEKIQTDTFSNHNLTSNDKNIYKLYNERLIHKLENKMLQLENELKTRIETEQTLIRSETLLNTVQKITKTGGWEWDVIKRKIYWTKEVYKIHGIAEEEYQFEEGEGIINRSLNCYATEEDQKAITKAFNQCIDNAIPYELQCKFISEKGDNLYIQTCGIPVIENGKVVKVHGYIMDCTQSVLKQLDQDNLKEQLIQSQKLEALGQLAGGIAHDFNNILNIIIGYSELIINTAPEDFSKIKEINEILKAGKKAANLTHQLLLFSRKNKIETEIININNIILECKSMLSVLIGSNIEIKTFLDDYLEYIDADSSQIYQVLMNIVLNARDALPNGGEIIIETSNFKVEPEHLKQFFNLSIGNFVLLTITDNGIGMNKETLEKIFEPFFTTKDEGKGTGLGLSTVYGIINRYNGKVYVSSELNIGTTFKIFFPTTKQPSTKN